jgi:hypothetical protein
MAASFPGGVKTWVTKVDNVDEIMADHINDLYEEVIAIETNFSSQVSSNATVAANTAARHTVNADTGTTSQTFQIQSGSTGSKIKNNAGVIEFKNAADNAYVSIKAGNIVLDQSNTNSTFRINVNQTDYISTFEMYEQSNWGFRMYYDGGANVISFGSVRSGTYAQEFSWARDVGGVTFNNNLRTNGRFGVGVTPTALVHLKAGTATANTAPLKFTSGTNLAAPEAGTVEYDGTYLYFSPSTTRHTILTTGTTSLTPTFTGLKVDTIDEKTVNNGVTIETVLIKDGLVDGVDVSQLKSDYDTFVGKDTYVHTQGSASNMWVITHNLGRYPSIDIVDSGGTTVYGESRYDSINQITLNFGTSFSGKAYLN